VKRKEKEKINSIVKEGSSRRRGRDKDKERRCKKK